jgi:hypothetical protein
MVAVGDMLVASVGNELLLFDPEHISAYETVTLPEPVELLLPTGDGRALAFGPRRVHGFAAESRRLTDVGRCPAGVRTGTVAPDGTAYVAAGLELYRMACR